MITPDEHQGIDGWNGLESDVEYVVRLGERLMRDAEEAERTARRAQMPGLWEI